MQPDLFHILPDIAEFACLSQETLPLSSRGEPKILRRTQILLGMVRGGHSRTNMYHCGTFWRLLVLCRLAMVSAALGVSGSEPLWPWVTVWILLTYMFSRY